jgi:hypothetical protein
MPAKNPEPNPGAEIVLFQTSDEQTRIEVRLQNETVWLTQAQMAELFPDHIAEHHAPSEGDLCRRRTGRGGNL